MNYKQLQQIKQSVIDAQNATITCVHNGRSLVIGTTTDLTDLIRLAEQGIQAKDSLKSIMSATYLLEDGLKWMTDESNLKAGFFGSRSKRKEIAEKAQKILNESKQLLAEVGIR